MEQIKVFYDERGLTLTVWFDEPSKETHAEEIGDEIIVMNDDNGSILGFEKLTIDFAHPDKLGVAFERVYA
jgi:uncharacterized protein YuzE